MRKLAVLTFVTLDGVMQGPGSPKEDRSDGFETGGWAGPYWPEVMAQVQREAMAQPYDVLFGRKTYEMFARHWTSVGDDNPVGAMLNKARKFVVTSSPSELTWCNSKRVTGDFVQEIVTLKDQDGPLLQVHGSWQLIQLLLAHRLIDEFRLWTFPVIVGAGKRLFSDNTVPTNVTLVKSEACSNGVVMAIYRHTAAY